ncbi:MAG: type II toxin-antitoxin system VapC family toxin [Leptolyngbyaceae cyanobacterium]
MSRVFADTFYWVASLSPSDQWHQAVMDWTRSHSGISIVTTDEVLTEVLTFYSGFGRARRQQVVEFTRRIMKRSDIQVIPQSRESFLAGMELYERRLDKGYSLTDCIAMHTMRQLNLQESLTNDQHFRQEGFVTVFGGERGG